MNCQAYSHRSFHEKSLHYLPGDLIVTHGTSFFDRLIQFFTQSYWNHAALLIDHQGDIIEAQSKGVKLTTINKYKSQDIYIVRVDLDSEDRQQVVEYGKAILARHEKYGFLTIVSITLKIITKSRLVIKLDGTQICSEFVANALARGGVIWYKDASLITPADLYNRLVKTKKGV